MNTLRIFISSPSDVQQERTVAGRVIERLQGKYWSFVRLDDVFWESKVARATAHFQDELLNPGQCDIVVGILWTRLGSPLPEKFRKLTGEAHATGTEWELAQAFNAYDASLAQTGDPLTAKPDVVVYRRTEERTGDPADADTQHQRKALTAFLEREFFNQDEHHTIKRAITFYATPDEFEVRLQNDLEQLILRRIPALKPGFEPPPISGPPFKDLSHFDFEDSDRFFGRNRAIRELQQRLMERAAEGMPSVLIYGGSGYGKSSLMRAGLAPVVTRPGGAAPGMDRWRRVLMQPGKGNGPICERLARVLLTTPTTHDHEQQKIHDHWPLPGLPELSDTTIEPDDTGEKWDVASLARFFADDANRIYAAAGVARTLDRIGHSLLLQIDQLEEVFAGETVTAAERETFFQAVAALTRTGRVWTVATMRSEYFPRIAETPALAALVGKDGGYILAPPSEQELREIIRFPALAARLDFERATSPREITGALTTADHLDDQILADAQGSPDALPLLEFTLHKLYTALLDPHGKRTSELLRWDAYAAFGGLKGAIARTAEDTFAALPPSTQAAGDALFGNLVRVDAGSRDVVTRKRPALAELRTVAPNAGDFLGAFLAARLLATDEDAGHPNITLAHEALITHWPRLAEWIARHRAILRSRQRLEENTRQWTESGRAKKLLLAEGRLAEAEEVERSGLFQLAVDEHALVTRSRQRAQRRLRVFQSAAALFAVLAAATTIAGWYGVRQARIAENQSFIANEQRALATRNANAEATQRQEAEKQTRKAEESAGRARETLSQSDFLQAVRLFNEQKDYDALAQLARSISLSPNNRAATYRLKMVLTHSDFALPISGLPHADHVISVSFSPDGKRIVTTANDKTARVWDAETGQPLTAPLQHAGSVSSAEFSPDGKRLITASRDSTARVWDTQNGNLVLGLLRHDHSVMSAQFSPDGKRILTASEDSAWVWDAYTEKRLAGPLHPDGELRTAVFSPDGTRIITTARKAPGQLWDTQSGRQLLAFGHWIYAASASQDGRRILAVSASENVAQVLDAQSGKVLTKLSPARHDTDEGQMFSGAFSPDEKWVVTVSDDRTARVWETSSGKQFIELTPRSGGVSAAWFSPDGERLLTLSDDKTVWIWPAPIGEKPGEPLRVISPSTVKLSPDGKRATTSLAKSAWIWDVRGGAALNEPMRPGGKISSAQFSPDGKRIVTASDDNTVRVWNVETSQPLTAPITHPAEVKSVQFSPDGLKIVIACGNQTVRFWNAQTGTPLTEPLRLGEKSSSITESLFSARFSPDGSKIVTASSDGTARIWDAESGDPLTEPIKHDFGVSSAHFSPDGRQIVTIEEDTNGVQLWDAQTGERMTDPLKHSDELHAPDFTPEGKSIEPFTPGRRIVVTQAAEFSSDGRFLITTARFNDTAEVWNTQSGQSTDWKLTHDGGFKSAHFSPDGKRIVTGAYDGTAQVWDAQSGHPVTGPLKHGNNDSGDMVGAEFSADGSRIVTLRAKSLQVWDAQTGLPLTGLIPIGRDCDSAYFSPDGGRVAIVTGDMMVVIDVSLEGGGAPEWLPRLAEAVAGQHLNDRGVFDPLGEKAIQALHEIRNQLSQDSSNDGWTTWGKWFLADRSTRTISPLSKVTVAEYMENRRKEKAPALHSIPESDVSLEIERAESELESVYHQLRNHLPRTGQVALKKEQRDWIVRKESMPLGSERRLNAIRDRVSELRSKLP